MGAATFGLMTTSITPPSITIKMSHSALRPMPRVSIHSVMVESILLIAVMPIAVMPSVMAPFCDEEWNGTRRPML